MILDEENGEDVQVDELTLHPRTRPPRPLGKPPFPTSERPWPCTVSGRLASGGFLLVRRPPRVGPLQSDRVPLFVPWGSGPDPPGLVGLAAWSPIQSHS